MLFALLWACEAACSGPREKFSSSGMVEFFNALGLRYTGESETSFLFAGDPKQVEPDAIRHVFSDPEKEVLVVSSEMPETLSDYLKCINVESTIRDSLFDQLGVDGEWYMVAKAELSKMDQKLAKFFFDELKENVLIKFIEAQGVNVITSDGKFFYERLMPYVTIPPKIAIIKLQSNDWHEPQNTLLELLAEGGDGEETKETVVFKEEPARACEDNTTQFMLDKERLCQYLQGVLLSNFSVRRNEQGEVEIFYIPSMSKNAPHENLHVVFVCDTSGSMKNYPDFYPYAKAAYYAIPTVRSKDLILFNHEVTRFDAPESGEEDSIDEMEDDFEPSGGTDLYKALNASFESSGSSKHSVIVFMTDGEHCPVDKENHHADREFESKMRALENASNRPLFMAFRFGNNADQNTLNRIVELTAGQKHDVTTSKDMVQVIQRELDKGNAFSPSKALEVFINKHNKQIIRFFTERGIQMMKIPNCSDASSLKLGEEVHTVHAYTPPYVRTVAVQTGEEDGGEFGLNALFGY